MKVVIMHVHSIAYRNRRTGICLIVVLMAIFKHHVPLRIMNVSPVRGYDWGRRYVQTLMNMAVNDRRVIHGPVIVIGNKPGCKAVLGNAQSIRTCLMNGFVSIVFGKARSDWAND
jgi:hypothetical protein